MSRPSRRKGYYQDLEGDYSRPGLVPPALGDRLIAKALEFGRRQDKAALPEMVGERDRLRVQAENKEWWPTHCEALRRGRGDILMAEHRDHPQLVYFCQEGPFYGREAGAEIVASWGRLLSQPGVSMCWAIVMFHGEVVYFEWRCTDDTTNETVAEGNATFLRGGHAGGIYLKAEKLAFFRDVHAAFFAELPVR
jgi:hypothetical protein